MTLQEIQALMGTQQDLLNFLGLTYAGEAEDGTPRYMDSNGSLVSAGMLQEMADSGALAEFQKNTLAGQGILEMPAYTASDWARVNELNNVNYATPEAYFDQLYGDGQMVDNYFVLPENNKQGAYVGTPIEGNFDTGFLQDFLKNAAIMGGAAFGMNALSGALAPTAGAASGSVASTLPESYWSMVADAGTGTMTDAAAGAAADGAAGQFSLAGGTAGNPAGGLYSGATGANGLSATSAGLGFTPSDALVSGMASGTSNALLTPAIAAAAGIPAASGASAATTMGGAASAAPAASAGSALSRLLDGTATTADYTSILGNLGATGLGLAGANAQSDAFKDVYNQQMTLGAPYRDRLAASYQPGFNLATADPAFQGALDTAAQAAARATSAKVGNPVDNPGAYSEMQKYITNSVALPYLQNYRSQLGTFGQLGTNTAGAASLGQAQSQGGTYNALGYGLGQLTQPDNPFKGLLSGFGKSGFSF